jgi:hypothetical protein
MMLAVNVGPIIVDLLFEEADCGPDSKGAGVYGGKEVVCLVVSEETAK